VETQLGRRTQAIVLGGTLERLVAEMHQLEARKVELLAEMASAARLSARVMLGRTEILGLVEAAVKDYRGVLTQQTTEARGILRELLA